MASPGASSPPARPRRMTLFYAVRRPGVNCGARPIVRSPRAPSLARRSARIAGGDAEVTADGGPAPGGARGDDREDTAVADLDVGEGRSERSAGVGGDPADDRPRPGAREHADALGALEPAAADAQGRDAGDLQLGAARGSRASSGRWRQRADREPGCQQGDCTPHGSIMDPTVLRATNGEGGIRTL